MQQISETLLVQSLFIIFFFSLTSVYSEVPYSFELGVSGGTIMPTLTYQGGWANEYGPNYTMAIQKYYRGSSFSPDLYASFSIIKGPMFSLNCHFSYTSLTGTNESNNYNSFGDVNWHFIKYSPMLSLATPPNDLPFLNHFIIGWALGYNAVASFTNDTSYSNVQSGSFVSGGFISTRPGNPGLYFNIGCYISPQTVKTIIPNDPKSLIFETAIGYGFKKLPLSLSIGFTSGYYLADSTQNIDGYNIPGYSELNYATFNFTIHWFIANYNMKQKPERKVKKADEIMPYLIN